MKLVKSEDVMLVCHPKPKMACQKPAKTAAQRPQSAQRAWQRAAGESRAPRARRAGRGPPPWRPQTSAGPQGSSTAPQKAGSAKRRLTALLLYSYGRCGHGGRRAHPCPAVMKMIRYFPSSSFRRFFPPPRSSIRLRGFPHAPRWRIFIGVWRDHWAVAARVGSASGALAIASGRA